MPDDPKTPDETPPPGARTSEPATSEPAASEPAASEPAAESRSSESRSSEPAPESLVRALRAFAELEAKLDESAARANAERFDVDGFRASFRRAVEEVLA